MVERTLNLPPEYLASMKKFVDALKPFADFSTKFKPLAAREPQDITRTVQQFRSFGQNLDKFQTNLLRNIDRLTQPLGPQAKTFFRTLNVESLLAKMPDVELPLPLAAGRLVLGVGGFIIGEVIKFFIEKTIGLARSVFADSVQATGLGTTVGGLRAFRSVFGAYPGAEQALAGVAFAQTSRISMQSLAMQVLRIKQMKDSAGQTMAAMLAAQRLVQSLNASNYMQTARILGLTSVFSPQLLRKMRGETSAQLRADIELEQRREQRFKLSPEVVKTYKDLNLALKKFTNTFSNEVIKALSRGHPSFIEGLTSVSKATTDFIVWALHQPITKKLINFVKYELIAFAKVIRDLTRLLTPTRYPGRARFAQRIGMPAPSRGVFRPGIPITRAPEMPRRVPIFRPGHYVPTAAPKVPTITPGRRAFAERVHMPKPPAGAIPSARKPGSPLTTDNSGRPINPNVLKQAEQLAATGDVQGVFKFIRSQGYNVDSAYCGDFVGAVVKAGGGTPPKGYPIATNWANYGTPVKPGEEQPGDIAILMRGHRPGETGGHVGIVGTKGQVGNGKFQFFGANRTAEYNDAETKYIFRRPPQAQEPSAAPSAATGGAATGNDLSRSAYDRMFAGTNLAGHYDDVVRSAQANGVPPSLMAGIMAHETGRGTSRFVRELNNPAGLMDPATGSRTGKSFNTIEEGIDAAGRTIGKNYRRGGGTIAGMAGIYAPPGAANDPGNQNVGWPAGVSGFQQQLRDGTAAQAPAIQPGVKLSPSGEPPSAVIIHHTGPAGSVEGIVNDWRTNRPGIGAQFIVDRNGVIHDVQKEFGYSGTGHVSLQHTPQSFRDKGIVNDKLIGIEVMAKDDKDILPIQRKVVEQFIRKNYANTPVYGHGEVNPGHREAEEGATIVGDIRRERAGGAPYGGPLTDTTRPDTPPVVQSNPVKSPVQKPQISQDEKPTPYSQSYFQNKAQKEDVPLKQTVKIHNSSESSDLHWSTPQAELYNAPF